MNTVTMTMKCGNCDRTFEAKRSDAATCVDRRSTENRIFSGPFSGSRDSDLFSISSVDRVATDRWTDLGLVASPLRCTSTPTG